VSVSRTRCLLGKTKLRVVGSSVAKSLSLCYHVRARKQIQESRFPRVRITDYCSDRPLMAFSPLSLNGPRFPHRFQLAFEPRDSFLHAPAVDFQLRFTRAARADSRPSGATGDATSE